jgi:hypothetical protein
LAVLLRERGNVICKLIRRRQLSFYETEQEWDGRVGPARTFKIQAVLSGKDKGLHRPDQFHRNNSNRSSDLVSGDTRPLKVRSRRRWLNPIATDFGWSISFRPTSGESDCAD